jgi:hypothetical protein
VEKLYSSSEARRKLKVSTSTFKRLIDQGKIRKITPPGKVQGMYVKEDVDRLAEEKEQFERIYLAVEPPERIEVVQATKEDDIKATVQIAKQLFGDNAYSLEKRMSWFTKVPNGDYVLKHEGEIVGYFSMQAIKPESANNIFHQRNGASIQLEDMEPIEPNKPLQIHISGIGVKMGISRQQAKIYGMHLLKGLFETLIKLGEQQIDIRKIWAKSSTVPGIKLSRDLGFTELGYINNEQIGFVLDTETSDVPAIKQYRETLQEATKGEKVA